MERVLAHECQEQIPTLGYNYFTEGIHTTLTYKHLSCIFCLASPQNTALNPCHSPSGLALSQVL